MQQSLNRERFSHSGTQRVFKGYFQGLLDQILTKFDRENSFKELHSAAFDGIVCHFPGIGRAS
ncbi:hypothetical protein SBDP1_40025 [Syntrophobacter sp. SbD1]|nr:hypothetical protein SBDP1_40025 [Syntrophobacter sp. SbD1]